MKRLLLLMVCIALLTPQSAKAEDSEKEQVLRFIDQMYQARAHALLRNQPDPIDTYYIPQERASRSALDHEIKRNEYMHIWAEKRNVQYINVLSQVRVTHYKKYHDQIKVSIGHSLKLTYIYKNNQAIAQDFGIGTKHVLTLKKWNGQWRVSREWYLDPLEEDPKLIPVWLRSKEHEHIAAPTAYAASGSGTRKYNRSKAIEYADKYAGLAWGAGNDHKYNTRYSDYNGHGGDCTNFSSQIIGDPVEGGGLRMTPSWSYQPQKGGSTAWVRTDSFKNFIIHGGYGRLIIQGKYAEVVNPSQRYPNGPFAEIKAGDFIGYEMKRGDVDHFSFVVGFDLNGYPLVNSHSADRYHVPWDLGWDKNTIFWLIHMKD
jgi:hypothetical protein